MKTQKLNQWRLTVNDIVHRTSIEEVDDEKNVHDLLASKVYFIGYASSTSWMEENQTRATGNLPLTYEQPTQT